MNILDHRILIPKSSQTIWEHLSDLSQNPTWQVDYSGLTFLTSRHSGVGVRWRYTTKNGREYVAETTAWYDGLGYEYTLVDGVSFRENKGRIRLQEIPEGTIVQWTFSYDIGGLLGGVRNAISYKRQVEGVMVDSLKTLWRVMNKANDEGVRETKSILRAGLDYEARAQYKPRHPSVKQEPSPTQQKVTPVIAEPPLSDEDTRPRAPIVVDIPEQETVEPAFLADLPAGTSEVSAAPNVDQTSSVDTSPSDRAADRVVILSPSPSAPPENSPNTTGESPSELVVPPGNLPEQPIIVEIIPAASPATNPSAQISDPVNITEPDPQPVGDTSEVSIFDVFGLPKPSETQEMRAVKLAEEPVRAMVQSLAVDHAKLPRAGLRLMLRRRRVRLRRPG